MSPIIMFAIAVGLPVVLLTVLRVNAVFVFLSLCMGSVLVRFLGSDAISLITTFFPHASSVSENTLEIVLLVLPALLTTIFMVHSVRKVKLILNILPALTVGLLLILLIEPLLSPGLQGTITGSSVWRDYMKAESLVIGAATLINLAFLWFERRRHAVHEKGGKHR